MRILTRGMLLALLAVGVLALPVHAWDRGEVKTFASLPPGAAHPEGITVDRAGNVYVTTFDVARAGVTDEVGHLFVFRHNGQLRRQVAVQNSSPLLLDLAFHPRTGALLVIDFGGSQVLEVDPVTGESHVFTSLADQGQPGLNVLTFDRDGNVYISASFAGKIFKTGPTGGAAEVWVESALLRTTGVPGFGANGLAFNNAHTHLFVANTGNDTIVKIPVDASGNAGTPAVFVNSVNGADGLIIDEHDNLWVAANQADEIVVIHPTGRVIAKLGDFDGLDRHGAPSGLLFPASLVRSGEFLYVTNLAIDLRLFDMAGAETNGTVDSPWAADVRVHTIAKLKARIPHVHGLRAVQNGE
jgi:sugar lactone lactonase YvrE